MAYCKKRVLKVIEKTKTKYEIELPEFLKPWILSVALPELSTWIAAFCFFYVFLPPVNGSNFKPEGHQ